MFESLYHGLPTHTKDAASPRGHAVTKIKGQLILSNSKKICMYLQVLDGIPHVTRYEISM